MVRPAFSFLIVYGLTFLISCGPTTSPPPALEELKDVTYSGLNFGSMEVTLIDGHYEDEVYVDGGLSRRRVVLLEDLLVTADFDSNGVEEAVVFLSETTGGTGEYLYLAVMKRQDGSLKNIGTVLLGDRVQIRGVETEGMSLFVHIVEIGPDDVGCCPGQLTTKSWDVLPRGLFHTFIKTTGRLSLNAIAGTEWTLERWGFDEYELPKPEITLTYEDGRITGTSGCNRYFTSAKEGKMPGDLSVGPPGSTQMACPDSVLRRESRFLNGLAHATKFGYFAGRLALTTTEDGELTAYLFQKKLRK